jgi:hypothetical protein
MRTIGFRAEKLSLRWVVLEGERNPLAVVAEDEITLGEKRPIAEELVLLRTAVLNLLKTYKPVSGAVRISGRPKGTGHILSMLTRARLEGVMKASKPLKGYKSQDEVRGIDMTVRGRKNDVFRDAVFAAISVRGD